MKTSIIITRSNLLYNQLCIESIRQYTSPNTYEIIVINNYSTEGTSAWLRQQSDV
ncbi:glycosyltransferase family 2 protein [Paenibacillus selenitireducens]|uniref:glycosyltransferase family 2 protein n=1 Tax=Paenibacillus selenitireducens TaxID=1324314 RepID=UPI001301F781|nr:hypothetical protein [Paenibacillus selenitireducens]